jgi:predicted cation transporter
MYWALYRQYRHIQIYIYIYMYYSVRSKNQILKTMEKRRKHIILASKTRAVYSFSWSGMVHTDFFTFFMIWILLPKGLTYSFSCGNVISAVVDNSPTSNIEIKTKNRKTHFPCFILWSIKYDQCTSDTNLSDPLPLCKGKQERESVKCIQ